MFNQNFASNFLSSPQSQLLEDHHSFSTETPQFSMECESNPELNYTKYINLDESDEDKRTPGSPKASATSKNLSNTFFKPIFSNLQQFVSSQLNQSDYLKLIEKSKRIIKRENAKKRVKMAKLQIKEEQSENEIKKEPCLLAKVQTKAIEKPKKQLEEEKVQGPANKDMKKVIQKLRNRISAQQSRDRKKMYLENLEKENQLLQEEIKALKEKKQMENVKEEKKINPIGILKLGMAFISMFMIIVGTKNQQSSGNGTLKEIKGCPEIKEEGANVLEKLSFWKRLEFEELNSKKIDQKMAVEILERLKMEDIEMLDKEFGIPPNDISLMGEKVKLFDDFMTKQGIDLKFSNLFNKNKAEIVGLTKEMLLS